MNEITVKTVQGIGDIFWVYQKVAPYYDKINFSIAIVCIDPIQTRAKPWLSLLPKVGNVSFHNVSGQQYQALIHGRNSLPEILASDARTVSYACNAILENGTRLEAIDPELEVLWDVGLKPTPCQQPFSEYVSLYVCGSHKGKDVWTVPQWVDFIRRLDIRLPILMVGAKYDQAVQLQVASRLNEAGIKTLVYTDYAPGNVLHLIKQSKLFIGYQSGLGILADNLDVPQVHVYFDHLNKLPLSWPKAAHLTDGTYWYAHFGEGPEAAASRYLLQKA